MKYDRIEGIDKDISKLVMGCDNQDDINEASKLWDHWIEVGGNITFILLLSFALSKGLNVSPVMTISHLPFNHIFIGLNSCKEKIG